MHDISPPLAFSSSQWASLWQHTYQRSNLNCPLHSVFRSQWTPCFPPLAATAELHWPSGCRGKGCSCCQMPWCFRVLLIKPFLSASESQFRERERRSWGKSEPLTSTVTRPAANTEPSHRSPTPSPRDDIQRSYSSAASPVCAAHGDRGFLMPLWYESSGWSG